MISRETIDRIFETALIEEVVADFVSLKRAGSNLKGLSPFSSEKTPSFMVSPAKQIFKDFSSGKGGSVVTFLMEHEHYTYPEALRYLARKYNIEIEETGQTDEEKEKRTERESLFLVNEFANTWFQSQLWESEEGKNIGLSYFHERGFTDETLREFQLGYSPEQWDALTQAATAKSYQLEYLTKSGLTIDKGSRKNDRFRGRVMFPILSHTGRVLGFGGRTLQKDAKIAKYLNSPESEIYQKSKTLYGIFQAKNELGKQDNCLLVEGYTDVISLHQAGVKNAVASSGTSLTRDQINLVKRYTQNITMLYDGDPAGIKASLRSIDLILEEGMKVMVLLFPDGEDPDSYAKKISSTELQDYIREEKQDFLRFKASLLLKDAGDNPLEKSRAAREMVESIAKIPDSLERNAYVQECASVLQMEERLLFAELAQVRKNLTNRQERDRRQQEQRDARLQVVDEKTEDKQTQPSLSTTPHYHQERAICWLILNYPHKRYLFHPPEEGEEQPTEEELPQWEESVAEYIITEFVQDRLEMKNPSFHKVMQAFSERFDKNGEILEPESLTRHNDSDLVETVADLVTEKHSLHDWQRKNIHPPAIESSIRNYTIEAVLRYKEKRIADLINDIQNGLKKTPIPLNKWKVN
ncbi:MAG: DNA primase [Owenweeksia sp.]|nr:DNA primase [Owenweeksia sp.]